MKYDNSNVFAKILSGDIPSKTIFESDHCIAINDLYPKTKVHILLIPKGSYISSYDFHETAPDAELLDYYRSLSRLIAENDLLRNGYRLVSNSGPDSHQEVPHFHTHILGGESLSRL